MTGLLGQRGDKTCVLGHQHQHQPSPGRRSYLLLLSISPPLSLACSQLCHLTYIFPIIILLAVCSVECGVSLLNVKPTVQWYIYQPLSPPSTTNIITNTHITTLQRRFRAGLTPRRELSEQVQRSDKKLTDQRKNFLCRFVVQSEVKVVRYIWKYLLY